MSLSKWGRFPAPTFFLLLLAWIVELWMSSVYEPLCLFRWACHFLFCYVGAASWFCTFQLHSNNSGFSGNYIFWLSICLNIKITSSEHPMNCHWSLSKKPTEPMKLLNAVMSAVVHAKVLVQRGRNVCLSCICFLDSWHFFWKCRCEEKTKGIIRRSISVSSMRQKCEGWVIQPKSEPSVSLQRLRFDAVFFFISPEYCVGLLEYTYFSFFSFLFFFSSFSECTQIKVI